MKYQKIICLSAILFLLTFCQTLTAQETPRVFLLDAKSLAETKQKIASGDKDSNSALDKLKRDAKSISHADAAIIL